MKKHKGTTKQSSATHSRKAPQLLLERWAKSEAEIPIHEETITVNINGKMHDWNLIHNFNMLDLDIDKAFKEWSKQTSEPTIDDFCRFVMLQATQEIELICFPKDKWMAFQQEQESKKNSE